LVPVVTACAVWQKISFSIEELRKLLLLYIEKNDKRVNEIIIALNNLIAAPPVETKTKRIGFNADNN
jgi:hypothetical protein